MASDDLPLPEPPTRGIADAGFGRCTPIQAPSLPKAHAGLHVAGHWTPGDHHRYTRADLARVAREAAAAGAAAVVTTAKDAERLRPFRPLPFDVHVLGHSVTLDPADDGPSFAQWLSVRRRTSRTSGPRDPGTSGLRNPGTSGLRA